MGLAPGCAQYSAIGVELSIYITISSLFQIAMNRRRDESKTLLMHIHDRDRKNVLMYIGIVMTFLMLDSGLCAGTKGYLT